LDDDDFEMFMTKLLAPVKLLRIKYPTVVDCLDSIMTGNI